MNKNSIYIRPIYLLRKDDCPSDGFLYIFPDYIFTSQMEDVLCEIIDYWNDFCNEKYIFPFNVDKIFPNGLNKDWTVWKAADVFLSNLQKECPDVLDNVDIKYPDLTVYYCD